MQRLKKIADEYEAKHKRKLMCSLVFDEMSIRQQILWSMNELNYTGYCNSEDDKDDAVIKQVIAFVLNGIDVNFEFPLAYFFIDSLNGKQRQVLLSDIIISATKSGIKISNITCDGYKANIVAFKLFGAKLNVFSDDDFQTFILNPVNNEKIYIFLDPCHMEKCARNSLASRKIFYDENNNKIEWRYIENLYNYSISNDFRTHKLTKKHIEYKRNEMNVRIAAQTFSNSVANAMLFLKDQGVDEFQGSECTIRFIRGMDRIFDIFNSKRLQHKNIFKKSLSAENKRVVFDFLRKFGGYFKTLSVDEEYVTKRATPTSKAIKTIKRVPLLKSRVNTAFNGFIIDIHSLLGMFTEYVEEKHFLENIFTYNILQDVIEIMFGRIRSRNGYNNNPNVQQFKGAYRRIQSNLKLDLSPNSNCRVFDLFLPDNCFYSDIYFISSKRAKIVMDENVYKTQKDAILNELIEGAGIDTTDNTNPIDIMDISKLDVNSEFMVEYIASAIETKIMTHGTFHCNSCRLVFLENKKSSLDNPYLSWKPCISTLHICKNAETFFKLFEAHKSNPRFDFKVLYCLIFRSMNLNELYSESKFDCDACHKYQFIKCVVGQYISTRASQAAKKLTLMRYDKMVRQEFNHLAINRLIEVNKRFIAGVQI